MRRASRLSTSRSKRPDGSCAIVAFGMPFSRMKRGQRAGVDAGKPDDAAALEPLIEIARGAVVRRLQ